MAKFVREIMNPELFSVREHEDTQPVLRYLLALGISSAPVLDQNHVPIGFVAFRDLLRKDGSHAVGDVMSRAVDVIDADVSIERAADLLLECGRHHVPVVDQAGRAIGFLSTVDVLRALRGLPPRRPETFPHHDPVTGLTWSDATRFDDDAVMRSPNGPGVYALLRSRPHERDRTVWSEASPHVRSRLRDILHTPLHAPPHLADAIEQRELFVRYAPAPSSRALYDAIRHSP